MAPRQRIPWGRLVAEGVVIVAGVLIALAADRFVQGLDERNLEEAYLQRLLGEFEQARTDLNLVVQEAEGRLEGAQFVVAALDGSLADSVTARQLVLGAVLAHWL